MAEARIRVTLNGAAREATVPPRMTLADTLRERFGCTGVHLGCEHGACGSCTVFFNGQTARSCLLLGVQADGAAIVTIEGLTGPDGTLHPMQRAFSAAHALQCGFCTPGMILTAVELLADTPAPTDEQIRKALSGNLCRCTGYANIVAAVRRAAQETAAGAAPSPGRAAGPGAGPGPGGAGNGEESTPGAPSPERPG